MSDWSNSIDSCNMELPTMGPDYSPPRIEELEGLCRPRLRVAPDDPVKLINRLLGELDEQDYEINQLAFERSQRDAEIERLRKRNQDCEKVIRELQDIREVFVRKLKEKEEECQTLFERFQHGLGVMKEECINSYSNYIDLRIAQLLPSAPKDSEFTLGSV
ncbi:hypothetical protein CsatB_003574 [Cannabis sativa]